MMTFKRLLNIENSLNTKKYEGTFVNKDKLKRGNAKSRTFLTTALLLSVAAVTACTANQPFDTPRKLSDVEKLRHASAVGSPFTQAIAGHYKEFAIREQDVEYDYPDALHFSKKGLSAAQGDFVMPEPVTNWDIDRKLQTSFINGRSRLIRLLDIGARDLHPEIAAKAQANFDCWLEQQEEGWQDKDIRMCKNSFLAALADLENAMAPNSIPSDVIARRDPPKIPEEPLIPLKTQENKKADISKQRTITEDTNLPESAKEPLTPENAKFLVFFDFDSAEVSESGHKVLKAIVQEIKANDSLETLKVEGHADRAGPKKYNMSLGQRRASAVMRILTSMGISASSISTFSKGEKQLLVETEDGVREPANRRVEITFE